MCAVPDKSSLTSGCMRVGGILNSLTVDQLQPESYEAFGEYLAVSWKDGHESMLVFSRLRDACPCANCRGEPDLMGRIMMPAQQEEHTNQSYKMIGIKPVGQYGLQLIWGDGHNTGIYTFGYLRQLCDCDLCVTAAQTGNGLDHDG